MTRLDQTHWRIQPSVLGGGGNLARGPNLGYPQNWKLYGFNPLFFGMDPKSLSKKWKINVFGELFGGGGKIHDAPFLGFGGPWPDWPSLNPPVIRLHCNLNYSHMRWTSTGACDLTRAPLGYFYNAPHCGGGAISSPPSDLRNYWTDSKNSSGIGKPWKNWWEKTNFIDLRVTSDVTGQVKVKMFDISGLVTSASKIVMLSTNKAN